jgi:hypothetical protein
MLKAKQQTKKLLEQGGMLQEGGTVDPVSGNDVPVGSMQEEVRDDIPAKLSEGEFVFPADVVRYIGLERLMQMRQAAKEGLKKMEAMGQMSNAEEATEEDDGEFESELDDIMKEIESEEGEGKEEAEMAEGGMAMPMEGQQEQEQMPSVQEQTTAAIPPAAVTPPIQSEPNAQQNVNVMPPSKIIQQDMAREGYSPEKQTEFEALMQQIAINKAMAMQRNNTLFVLSPSNTEGTVRLNSFTADDPDTMKSSVGQLFDKLQEAKVSRVESQTKDTQMLDILESGGYKPQVSETDGVYNYIIDIGKKAEV